LLPPRAELAAAGSIPSGALLDPLPLLIRSILSIPRSRRRPCVVCASAPIPLACKMAGRPAEELVREVLGRHGEDRRRRCISDLVVRFRVWCAGAVACCRSSGAGGGLQLTRGPISYATQTGWAEFLSLLFQTLTTDEYCIISALFIQILRDGRFCNLSNLILQYLSSL
jgi:hypothetical protein